VLTGNLLADKLPATNITGNLKTLSLSLLFHVFGAVDKTIAF